MNKKPAVNRTAILILLSSFCLVVSPFSLWSAAAKTSLSSASSCLYLPSESLRRAAQQPIRLFPFPARAGASRFGATSAAFLTSKPRTTTISISAGLPLRPVIGFGRWISTAAQSAASFQKSWPDDPGEDKRAGLRLCASARRKRAHLQPEF